jgi:hypothetical protein
MKDFTAVGNDNTRKRRFSLTIQHLKCRGIKLLMDLTKLPRVLTRGGFLLHRALAQAE